MQLVGTTAVATGGSNGIGYAVAHDPMRHGVDLTYRVDHGGAQ
jgi:NAD(P)-dependent dehydrogenase (short-subunit alcohol dehydrogenase family)